MDPRRFDTLAKSLSSTNTRRRLMGLVAGLPLAGALGGLLGEEGVDGQGNVAGVGGGGGRRRRRRRRGRHHPGDDKKNRKGKHNKKKCTPESVAQTCAGKCGSVTNNCQEAVNCGCCAPADCPAQTCQTVTCTGNQCTYEDAVDGTACGPNATCCAGGCRDLHTDSQHCGACGTSCGSGTTCVSSACKTSCPGPANCFSNPSGCICEGSESGALVCVSNDYAPRCTKDLECEQALGPGRFCAVDVGSSLVCQFNTGNKCVG